MNALSRRAVLRRTAQLIAVCVATPCLAAPVRAADSCADPASESLRASLNYVPVASDAAKSCGGCGFFARDEAAPSCGACAIMSGPVDAAGYCDSWSPPS